jgi:hypothetical protein
MAKKPRYRTKEAREIADEVREAGGTVEISGKGHLVVTGPSGRAIVGSVLSGPTAHDMARRLIARHAGITIGRKGCGGGRKAG